MEHWRTVEYSGWDARRSLWTGKGVGRIGDASIDNCRASSPAETEIMRDKSNTTLRNRLYLLTFAHAVVDAYSTTLPHLLPLLFRKLVSHTTSWSSLAGLLIAVSGVFNSFSQVIFGQLADRGRTAVFLIIGVAIP